jgi:Spy/CpxP family protein refolding chaperone
MFKMMRTITVVLVLLMMATTSFAERRGRWWLDPHVVKNLDLTNDEVQKLENAFNTSSIKMIELKSKVEQEQYKLQALLEQQNMDEDAINTQIQNLEKARSALGIERTRFVVQVRKIIGYEQFQKYLDMRRR